MAAHSQPDISPAPLCSGRRTCCESKARESSETGSRSTRLLARYDAETPEWLRCRQHQNARCDQPNRVDLYTQAFPDGTNIDEAWAQVSGADAQRQPRRPLSWCSTTPWGRPARFWDIESATLGKWFSGPKVGDSKGVMGIELSTVDSSGNTIYEPSHATTANVDLAPVDQSQNC